MKIRISMRRHAQLAGMALIALLLSAPGPARAASITIDAANLDNQVSFSFGQFEGGFSINGSAAIPTGNQVHSDGIQLNFTGQWIDLGAASAFSRTVYWVNAKKPDRVREVFSWTVTPSGGSGLATISGFFQSTLDPFKDLSADLGAVPGGTSAADIIVKQKDGSHDLFHFSAAFLGGRVATGLPVPEPGALLIFGLGLGVLAIARRRPAA